MSKNNYEIPILCKMKFAKKGYHNFKAKIYLAKKYRSKNELRAKIHGKK